MEKYAFERIQDKTVRCQCVEKCVCVRVCLLFCLVLGRGNIFLSKSVCLRIWGWGRMLSFFKKKTFFRFEG